MIAIFGVIGLLCIACLLEQLCGIPAVEGLHSIADRLVSGNNYRRLFLFPVLIAAFCYTVGIIVMGPFIGVYEAATQVGTLFLVALCFGMVSCWISFGQDVGGHTRALLTGKEPKLAPSFSRLFSAVFVTSVWGCAILLTFYDHSRSGALLDLEFHPMRLFM